MTGQIKGSYVAISDQTSGGHVFISYSRADRRYVTRLVKHLTAAGVPVWLDKEIPTGHRWDAVIREAIDTAVAVIVVMTPTADESSWVTNEVHHALEIKKPILPLLLDGRQFFTLIRIHHEDVTGRQMPGESFMAELSDLLDAETRTSAHHQSRVSRLLTRSRPALTVLNIVALALALVLAMIVMWPEGDQSQQQDTGKEAESRGATALISTFGAAVDAVAFSPDGKFIATGGGNDHTVRLWNTATGRLVRPLVGEGVATAVAFNPRDGSVVSNSDLAMWNPSTGEKGREIQDGGWSVGFRPDGEMVAVGGIDNTVRLWATTTGKLIRTIATDNPQDIVECLAFSPDGTVLAAGSYDGTVQLWNPRTGAKVRTIFNANGAHWMAFGANSTLFVASGSGPVQSWNTATGAQTATFAEATTAAVSRDGSILATAGESDYSVRLWDTATGNLKDILVGHGNAVRAIAFSHDGRLVATGGDDQTVRLWEVLL